MESQEPKKYSLKSFCGDCNTPAIVTLNHVEQHRVLQNLNRLENMLKQKMPKCDTCEKAPSKYYFTITNEEGNIIPKSFFEGNIDTITT